jgi:hypothetical protein
MTHAAIISLRQLIALPVCATALLLASACGVPILTWNNVP